MKEYFRYVDIAKGIGICLVILGHGLFPYHYAIDSFHMPLFFIIAGCTFYPKSIDLVFIGKKIDRIFVPYLFFSIISAAISFVIEKIRGGSLYEGPFNGPLWFLPVMFGSIVFYHLFVSSIKHRLLLNLTMLMIAVYEIVLAYFNNRFLPFNMDNMLLSMVFIHIGIYLKNIISLKNKYLLFFVVVIFYGVLLLFSHKYGMDKGLYLDGSIFIANPVLAPILAVFGSSLILCISYLLEEVRFLSSIFLWLGKNSLVIMAVHFPFIQITNMLIASSEIYHTFVGKVLMGILEFLLIMLISVGIVYVCKRRLSCVTGYSHLLVR